jgi:hypothetical protein
MTRSGLATRSMRDKSRQTGVAVSTAAPFLVYLKVCRTRPTSPRKRASEPHVKAARARSMNFSEFSARAIID